MINSYHSIGRRALALALSVLLAVSTLSTQTFTVSASDADSGTEYGGVDQNNNSADTDDAASVSTVSGSNVILTPAAAQQTVKTVTAWSWNDPDGWLTENQNTGEIVLALGEVDEVIALDEITDILPSSITATVDGAEETLTLAGWSCDNYPANDIPTGTYTFTATLQDGYALSDDAATLSVPVVFGGDGRDGEHNGYTYTFSGWSMSDATIANGAFTMPGKNVALIGNWTKTANSDDDDNSDDTSDTTEAAAETQRNMLSPKTTDTAPLTQLGTLAAALTAALAAVLLALKRRTNRR